MTKEGSLFETFWFLVKFKDFQQTMDKIQKKELSNIIQ
jgi:hypothetical protein